MPWRKIAVLGIVGSFNIAGCTVTTSDGNVDSGFMGETGGTGNQGGSTSVGGTGGASTTVVQCTANYQAPAAGQKCGDDGATTSCDSCLQTKNCTDAYKACYLNSACTTMITAMMQCMYDAAVANGGTLPTGQDGLCQTEKMSGSDAATIAEAKALWGEIQISLDCSIPCCAEV